MESLAHSTSSVMLSLKFAYKPELLLTVGGREQCFEEARASAWFLNNRSEQAIAIPESLSLPLTVFNGQPLDREEGSLSRCLQLPAREAPLDAFMVQRYAERLMKEREEECVDWGDPFTSAEIYILQVCRETTYSENSHTSSSIYPEDGFVSRRKQEVYVRSSPYEPSEKSVDYSSPAKRQSLEFPAPFTPASVTDPRISTIAVLPGERQRDSSLSAVDFTKPLGRKDRHLIDVSNFFTEEGVVNKKSPYTIATQIFSPSQMRDILGRQAIDRDSLEKSITTTDTDKDIVINPWSSKFTDLFWTKITSRMTGWSNYFIKDIPKPPKNNFEFGHQQYGVEKRLGSGAFGTVYLVRLTTILESLQGADKVANQLNATVVSPELEATVGRSRTGIARIVKLQCPDYPLEFYHMRELRKRLTTAFSTGKILMDVRPSVCPALALTYSPGVFSSLLIPYYPLGLLEWINFNTEGSNEKRSGYCHSSSGTRLNSIPRLDKFEEELLVLYLSVELLWLIEGLHKHAGMIHGDIKPDNFRVTENFPQLDSSALDTDQEYYPDEEIDFSCCLMSGRSTKVLVLIDFGLCIDMARFPKNTVFMQAKDHVKKRSFPCIEMLTGRPWSYQLDLFNIAGVIYTLVFKKYMKVKCVANVWQPELMPRSSRVYRAVDVWRSIIISLLNIKSCAPEDYPDLSLLRRECEVFLLQHANEYNVAAEKANQILSILMANR